jgi:hypothetical protein
MRESKERNKIYRKILEINGNEIAERIHGLEEKCTLLQDASALFCTVTIETKGKVKSADESNQIIHYLEQFVHQLMKAE